MQPHLVGSCGLPSHSQNRESRPMLAVLNANEGAGRKMWSEVGQNPLVVQPLRRLVIDREQTCLDCKRRPISARVEHRQGSHIPINISETPRLRWLVEGPRTSEQSITEAGRAKHEWRPPVTREPAERRRMQIETTSITENNSSQNKIQSIGC